MRRAFAPPPCSCCLPPAFCPDHLVNQLEESVRSLPGGDDLAALRTHLLLIIRSLSATE